jgi:hypothetical protein
MTKKIGWVAIVVLAALAVFAVFAMSMRRSHMMGGGGSQLELVAVSADGTQIPPSADVTQSQVTCKRAPPRKNQGT